MKRPTRPQPGRIPALAGLIAAAFAGMSGCCDGNINHRVVELRVLHGNYRAAVVAKPGLDPDKVEQLGSRLDSVLGKLEELTR